MRKQKKEDEEIFLLLCLNKENSSYLHIMVIKMHIFIFPKPPGFCKFGSGVNHQFMQQGLGCGGGNGQDIFSPSETNAQSLSLLTFSGMPKIFR